MHIRVPEHRKTRDLPEVEKHVRGVFGEVLGQVSTEQVVHAGQLQKIVPYTKDML